MTRFGIMISCLAFIFLISCESSTEPGDKTEPFRFSIRVTDVDGHPAENLRVSGWNDIDNLDPVSIATKSIQAPLSMTIYFAVAEENHINVSVYDFHDYLVGTLVNKVLPAGVWSYAWLSSHEVPNGIYKFRMVASDTLSGKTLFRDSIYPVKWRTDAESSIYGYTNAHGVYETTNDLLFPNVLDGVPELIHVNMLGDSLGTFQFEDSVRVFLMDTTIYDSQRVCVAVSKGSNEFSIVWDPQPGRSRTGPGLPSTGAPQTRAPSTANLVSDDPPFDFVWRLYQNSPNPFN